MKASPFKVCIDIFSLVNRGDWLMFEAILQEIRQRFPSALIGVPESTYLKNEAIYHKKGVLPVITATGKQERFREFLTKTGAFLKHRIPPLYAKDIDLLLFSPGFRFSDQFGEASEAKIKQDQKYFEGFAKKGRKIVFMPQAFGPFQLEGSRKHILSLKPFIDHIYAREQVSFQNLMEPLPDATNISISPDFTCSFKPESYPLPFPNKGYVVIIPNRQMLVRSASGIASKYCDFMLSAVRHLKSIVENIIFLNHEGKDDLGVIDFLNASIDNSGLVLKNLTAGECKSVIAVAKFVLTSRYHGLVSSLTEAVPTLCTSWSHKYQELVEELGCPNSCISLSDSNAISVINDIIQRPASYTAVPDKLDSFRKKVSAMWEEIFSLPSQIAKPSQPIHPRELFYISPNRMNVFF